MCMIKYYQYISPLILTPISFYLWKSHCPNYPFHYLLIFSTPILWAYIIPAIGTNILHIWEFNTALKIGRFRPHHGFVFGSITGVITFLLYSDNSHTLKDVGRFAIMLGSFLAFWNVLYDIKAVKSKIINVFNRPYQNGEAAEAIVLDYAPWLFGFFGFSYGIAIGLLDYFKNNHLELYSQPSFQWAYSIGTILITLTLPVILFVIYSYLKYGDHGLYHHPKKL